MKKLIIALTAIVSLALSTRAFAATLNVSPGAAFDAVYNRASNGDTIIIGDGAMINDAGSVVRDAPFVIEKAITIQGVSAGTLFYIRRGGLILGADVVFKDMDIALSNPRRSAIIANGHSLTLDNVKWRSGNRVIHLFAGGYVHDPRYGYTTAVPAAGNQGSITILGDTNIEGNIYLGGMNTAYTGSATLKFDATAGAKFKGKLYARGALETYVADTLTLDPSQFDVAPPTPDDLYPTSGKVSIELNDPANEAIFDCVTGGTKNAEVTIVEGASVISPTIIKPGTLALKAGPSPTSSVKLAAASVLLNGIDISIPANCALNLQMLSSLPRVNTFNGGGDLVLGREQTIYIDGAVNGQTKFRTGDGSGGYGTGFVMEGRKYIVAPNSSSTSFTLAPMDTQSTFILEYSAADGSWTAKDNKPPVTEKTLIASFTLDKTAETFSSSKINDSSGVEIDFSYGKNNDGDLWIEDVPITVEVLNGSSYWSGNPSGTKGNYYAFVSEANMKFTWSATGEDVGKFYLYADGGQIADGTYTIIFTIPKGQTSVGKALDARFTLTVTSGTVTPPTPQKYRATITSDGSGSSGSGEYEAGARVTIAAGTKNGHTFKQWNASGASISDLNATQSTTTFTMPAGAVTLTAEWTQDPVTPPAPQKYRATVTSDGSGSSGSGEYEAGARVQIDAGTKSGHTFKQWNVSGASISDLNATQSTTTFTMPAGAVTLTAEWTQDPVTPPAPQKYRATVTSDGSGSSGSGEYEAGARVTIAAGTKSGHTFKQWNVSGASISDLNATQSTTTFTMPAGAVTLTAEWTQDPVTPPAPQKYRATVTSDGSGSSGSGEYEAGARVTIASGTKSGHTFKQWNASGASISDLNATQSTTTFTMPAGAVTLTAEWTQDPVTPPAPTPTMYSVYVNGGGIGASGAGSYLSGARVSINAGVKDGYEFVRWTVRGATITDLVEDSRYTTFTMPTGSVVLTAEWKESSSNGGGSGGTISPDMGGGAGGATPPAPEGPRVDYSDKITNISTLVWNIHTGGDILIKIEVEYSRFLHRVIFNGIELIEGVDFLSQSGSTIVSIRRESVLQHVVEGVNDVVVKFTNGDAAHTVTVNGTSKPIDGKPNDSSNSGSSGGGGCATGSLIAIAALALIKKKARKS